MYALPAAPRPIGGVLDDAIRLYRASFSRCWVLAAIAGVINAAASTYYSVSLGSLVTPRTAQGAAAMLSRIQAMYHSPALWINYGAIIFVWLVIRAAIIVRQHAAATGQQDSVGSALVLALRRLPSAFVTVIVWMLLVGVGFVLLFIPGIWLWGMFQLWFVALCVEGLPPVTPLGRSWRLVEGNWWRATTVVTVAYIIVLVLSMTAAFLTGFFFAVTSRNIVAFTLTSQLLGAAIGVFTTPLLTVVMLSIYYDLKLRREGGDLAVRLSSLQPV
jgi:hypothetical protein